FFTRKKKQKNLPSATSAKGGFCSRARLKISKGQVVVFEKITQKISTFKPLLIFILSVLSSLPKARLSKNKIFIVFRFSSITDKTTQNKKDTRINFSYLLYLNLKNYFIIPALNKSIVVESSTSISL